MPPSAGEERRPIGGGTTLSEGCGPEERPGSAKSVLLPGTVFLIGESMRLFMKQHGCPFLQSPNARVLSGSNSAPAQPWSAQQALTHASRVGVVTLEWSLPGSSRSCPSTCSLQAGGAGAGPGGGALAFFCQR